DFDQLAAIAAKVDLPQLMQQFAALDEKQLRHLTAMLSPGTSKKALPPIDGDFYDVYHKLTPEERAIQLKVRAFMEKEVKPLVNHYWLHDEFPFELIDKMRTLDICGVTYKGYGCPGLSFVMEGV